jgi:hypothetical protein
MIIRCYAKVWICFGEMENQSKFRILGFLFVHRYGRDYKNFSSQVTPSFVADHSLSIVTTGSMTGNHK